MPRIVTLVLLLSLTAACRDEVCPQGKRLEKWEPPVPGLVVPLEGGAEVCEPSPGPNERLRVRYPFSDLAKVKALHQHALTEAGWSHVSISQELPPNDKGYDGSVSEVWGKEQERVELRVTAFNTRGGATDVQYLKHRRADPVAAPLTREEPEAARALLELIDAAADVSSDCPPDLTGNADVRLTLEEVREIAEDRVTSAYGSLRAGLVLPRGLRLVEQVEVQKPRWNGGSVFESGTVKGALYVVPSGSDAVACVIRWTAMNSGEHQADVNAEMRGTIELQLAADLDGQAKGARELAIRKSAPGLLQ